MSTIRKRILSLPGLALCLGERVIRRLLMTVYRPLFASHGRNLWFDPAGSFSFSNIHVGDNVSLGIRPNLIAAHSTIVIGNNVMFGPEVAIFGGNHRTTLVGRFMCDITDAEKRPDDDLGVTIADDVWVGTRAIILDGVTIGRGVVVAAGAIVTKNVPPYAIAAGAPARVVKFRWDVETILKHEAVLYPAPERYLRADLERWQTEAASRSTR
jgi:acetyltransferase-like isoleucine patch superfamily enzyme